MKSSKSDNSVKTFNSRSSSSTLPVPFYATSFWNAFGSDEKGAGEKVRSKSGIELSGELRMTNKFPGKFEKDKKERWTGFKWALLVSIITVSSYLTSLMSALWVWISRFDMGYDVSPEK
jgi:hypothetical protein